MYKFAAVLFIGWIVAVTYWRRASPDADLDVDSMDLDQLVSKIEQCREENRDRLFQAMRDANDASMPLYDYTVLYSDYTSWREDLIVCNAYVSEYWKKDKAAKERTRLTLEEDHNGGQTLNFNILI